jgi:cyclic pyranopterin phosphate synthase
MTEKLTHVDERGAMRMVDVGDKEVTSRLAMARAVVTMEASTAKLLRDGKTPKGDVLAAVRLAGIMGAKNTSTIVPLCHPIALSKVEVEVEVGKASATITTRVRCEGKTGVEMEALTAASAAALCLYDMLKAKDRGMTFEVALLHKEGGKSGVFTRAASTKKGAPRKGTR